MITSNAPRKERGGDASEADLHLPIDENVIRAVLGCIADSRLIILYRPDIGQPAMWWSPGSARLLGYESAELESSIGALHALVHPDDLPALLDRAGAIASEDAHGDFARAVLALGGELLDHLDHPLGRRRFHQPDQCFHRFELAEEEPLAWLALLLVVPMFEERPRRRGDAGINRKLSKSGGRQGSRNKHLVILSGGGIIAVNGNGQLGIGADQSDQLVIRQASVNRNNIERFKNAPVAGAMMAELIVACEQGRDHDRDPLPFRLEHLGRTIDVGFYSRRREINPESSFSVLG